MQINRVSSTVSAGVFNTQLFLNCFVLSFNIWQFGSIMSKRIFIIVSRQIDGREALVETLLAAVSTPRYVEPVARSWHGTAYTADAASTAAACRCEQNIRLAAGGGPRPLASISFLSARRCRYRPKPEWRHGNAALPPPTGPAKTPWKRRCHVDIGCNPAS